MISLNNIDVTQLSDCTWDGVPICQALYSQIQTGHILVEQNGTQINIDIPLTNREDGIFNNAPIFALLSQMVKY